MEHASFTSTVKVELCARQFSKAEMRQAQAYGMFAFAQGYSPDKIQLSTESAHAARAYSEHLTAFAPQSAVVEQTEKKVRGRTLYEVGLIRESDRIDLLALLPRLECELAASLTGQEERGAFLAGVFLVCGNITNPEKGYHIEFAVREKPLADGLHELLEGFLPGASLSHRRGHWVVYYKDKGQIQDLLALMGAGRASLAVIEVEMLKEVRNQAMRLTNAETANIDKTIRAAGQRVEDIKLLLDKLGLMALPEELREVALTRLEHPELSLRELAETFQGRLSRAAVHRRLEKLSKLAEEIRGS
ncbi:MAG: DNA-binding protein WhiA [Oscillospiraceae bacterium]|nr:DNA-binding protein WhiA [Oscillospiraceae bacterium]